MNRLPFSQQTIYRDDYKEKPYERTEAILSESKSGNPVTDVFPTDFPWRNPENIQKYVYKTYEKGGLGNWCPPLDTNLLSHHFFDQKGSTYMADFCTADDNARRGQCIRKTLPENWTMPTTQRSSYRDPDTWGTFVKKKTLKPLPDNLVPNDLERKILQVTTGESEYMGRIGETAERILAKNF